MFNVRQERTLAIDGDIIRSMPSDTASAADTTNKVVRTHALPHSMSRNARLRSISAWHSAWRMQTSFDVASVISCTLRGADTFRIVFQRGRDTKVYDYETPEAGTFLWSANWGQSVIIRTHANAVNSRMFSRFQRKSWPGSRASANPSGARYNSREQWC